MKKTYVTKMPDHIGAFLQASRCFASLDMNITRVSYNKAIDSHTLFIDAEGDERQHEKARKRLEEIGYLQEEQNEPNVVLLEFRLRDVAGSVTGILELIASFNFNISYISSQGDGSEYQLFKMGLFVDETSDLTEFIKSAEKLCNVRMINYNRSEKVFDNSIFYDSFVTSLIEASGISTSNRNDLLVNTNLAMQILDERGLSPYKTFDSISGFADLLASCKGKNFAPRITKHKLSEGTELTLIEPPCGSNTAIMRSGNETLFIDSGYAYYKEEMIKIFREEIPGFDTMKKTILITHADVDHCGLLPMFDEIIASRRSAECLRLEYEGKDGFRERNVLHKPYIRICKTLTEYMPPSPDKVTPMWREELPDDEAIWQIGFFTFGDLRFEVYEGRGGHLPGEIILIDYEHHLAFTGDVYVNTHGMTDKQRHYNQYAPILMTSVDTDPQLCAQERRALLQRLGAGKWQIFGAHGYKKDYEVNV